MYTEEMLESIKKVEAKRAENAAMEPRRMTAEEKDQVLKENHPDYREDQFDVLSVGPNKGEKAPKELVKMLQSDSRLKDNLPDLSCPDYETDVLIIGGGGAGASAAIEADNAGEKGMIVTVTLTPALDKTVVIPRFSVCFHRHYSKHSFSCQ